MAPTATPATTAPQTKASKLFGLLFTLGIAAAAIFVKNPNHQTTAENIINVLNAELPNIESII
jgi:hypothetical protein